MFIIAFQMELPKDAEYPVHLVELLEHANRVDSVQNEQFSDSELCVQSLTRKLIFQH